MTVLRTTLRLALAAFAYLVCLALAYGLLMPSVPADPTAAASPIPPALVLPLVVALNTAVMAWLILRSWQVGWRLVGTMIVVLFGVQTFLPQVESWLFLAFPGFAAQLPAALVPRIMVAGLIHACLWIPLAVLILGRWKSDPESAPPASAAPEAWSWKVPAAALAYVVVYFVFGYYVAWRSPAVRTYYEGTDTGLGTFWLQMRTVLHDTPWLPFAQFVRGIVWTGLGLLVLRSARGSWTEKALAVATLFAVVMSAGLLLPNPYMPYVVRQAHLLETASSDFLFGLWVAWLFGGPSARPPQ
jgi:hypothetical protein